MIKNPRQAMEEPEIQVYLRLVGHDAPHTAYTQGRSTLMHMIGRTLGIKEENVKKNFMILLRGIQQNPEGTIDQLNIQPQDELVLQPKLQGGKEEEMLTKNPIKTVELLEMIGMATTLLGLNPIEWRTVTWLSTMVWEKCSHY